jgi:hypothetical protein
MHLLIARDLRQHKKGRRRRSVMGDVIDDRVCVVCFRVADMPKPKVSSERWKCSKCGEAIWVAKDWSAGAAKICNRCMKRGGSKKPSGTRLH